MVEDLDAELRQLEAPAIPCRGCGHGYDLHDVAAGGCSGRFGGWSSPAAAVPCMCAGFRWVDPAGPSVGSYLDPPTS